MLRLMADHEGPPEPDTDFEFLSDSEQDTGIELRTIVHPRMQAPPSDPDGTRL